VLNVVGQTDLRSKRRLLARDTRSRIVELKAENAAVEARVSELPGLRWQCWMRRQAISSAHGQTTSRRYPIFDERDADTR